MIWERLRQAWERIPSLTFFRKLRAVFHTVNANRARQTTEDRFFGKVGRVLERIQEKDQQLLLNMAQANRLRFPSRWDAVLFYSLVLLTLIWIIALIVRF